MPPKDPKDKDGKTGERGESDAFLASNDGLQSSDPLVSIITPAFNSQNFICQTISSVQEQTYENWEMLVVIDSGTTDSTPTLVQKLAEKDPRIRLIVVPNNHGRGLALSRNYAVKLAKGTYLAFLDSDDLWLANKLRRQIDLMIHHNWAFTCTAFRRLDSHGKILGRLIEVPRSITYQRLLQQNCIGCLTVVINRESVGEIEFLETKHEDFILWLEILKRGIVCHGINEDLARYRIVAHSRSADKMESIKNTWRIYRQHEGLSISQSLLRLGQFGVRNLAKYSRF